MDAENLIDPKDLEDFWRSEGYTPTERAAVDSHAAERKDDLFPLQLRRDDIQDLVALLGSRPHTEAWSLRVYYDLLEAIALGVSPSPAPQSGPGIVNRRNVLIELPPEHALHLRQVLSRQPTTDRASEEILAAVRLTMEASR